MNEGQWSLRNQVYGLTKNASAAKLKDCGWEHARRRGYREGRNLDGGETQNLQMTWDKDIRFAVSGER